MARLLRSRTPRVELDGFSFDTENGVRTSRAPESCYRAMGPTKSDEIFGIRSSREARRFGRLAALSAGSEALFDRIERERGRVA